MEFTKEERLAIFNLVQYAGKDIGPEDEPLYNDVYKKLETICKDREA